MEVTARYYVDIMLPLLGICTSPLTFHTSQSTAVTNSTPLPRVLRWYFAVISMSGVFAVTFSVIFAYVADITQEHERSTAYGLVSRPLCSHMERLN